jgi:hypothetical protein
MTPEKRASLVGRGLAGELRFLRRDRRMTCQVVADLLGWQASKMSRMETGQQGITVADLASLLTIYHVIGAERERLLRMVDRQDEPGQWETYSTLPEESKTLIRLEPDASSIITVQPLLIPGLVQTPDYCREVMKSCNVPAEHINTRVSARLARQVVLANEETLSIEMIVDEMALRRVHGSNKIMARQARAVLAAAERPNVTLRVLPFVLGGHTGLDGAFVVMDFPRNKPIVYLEHKMSGVFLEEPDQVEFYRREAATLVEVALSPAESAEFVATIAREHEQK